MVFAGADVICHSREGAGTRGATAGLPSCHCEHVATHDDRGSPLRAHDAPRPDNWRDSRDRRS